ncbi:MAG: site-specific DNA-methyltransferase [Nitrosopumilus sp.]|nr:site-specific DNA-methyltransferase [Nitrosopumilus sp.]
MTRRQRLSGRFRMNDIHRADCIRAMSSMAPGSVDVIVTSPPYNIGIRYSRYEDSLPFDEYLGWMAEFGRACSRVLRNDGSLFLNIGDRASDEFRSFLVARSVRGDGLVVQNTIHWVKSIAVPECDINMGHFKPVNSGRYINNCHEYIFHMTRTGSVKVNKRAVGVPYADKTNIARWSHSGGSDSRCRGNQWYVPYETVASEKEHPAAFPLRLPEMCIKLAGEGAEKVVLDPFAGSGSTLLAAKGLGMRYIGFEIDPRYVRMARARLAGAS